MRRLLSVLLAMAMAAALVPAGLAELVQEKDSFAKEGSGDGLHTIAEKDVTMYIGSMDAWEDVKLYFVDGVEDLPWMELKAFADFFTTLRSTYGKEPNYRLDFTAEGDTARITRETDYYMEIDCAQDTIYFDDFDGFRHDTKDTSLLDMVAEPGYDSEGNPQLIKRLQDTNYDRYGIDILLELGNYDIDIFHQGAGYYIPMQTLSDFLVAPAMNSCLFYNGKAAFFGNKDTFGVPGESLTPMGEYYYSAEPGPRSEVLAEYGYSELCLMLDNLYGLSDIHDIEMFDRFFYQTGMTEDLMSTDPATADQALYDLITLHLDDLHSVLMGHSPAAGKTRPSGGLGIAARKSNEDEYFFRSARQKYYPDGCPFYEEVGNTAYITFDRFISEYYGHAFYNAFDAGDPLPEDTIGNIILAHDTIYRVNSPVENVVIDLSCNGGGSVDAAIFLLGWILGDATFALKNTFTGAQSTAQYRIDVNLDRLFDSRDEVDDKNVYCLISPNSFSCGNLVPMAFKASPRVKLLGSTSGGGTCIVQNMSTAWGDYFTMSGTDRMSFQKNGSFYDIDRGVEPDFPIDKVDHYYDRQALTEYINSFF